MQDVQVGINNNVRNVYMYNNTKFGAKGCWRIFAGGEGRLMILCAHLYVSYIGLTYTQCIVKHCLTIGFRKSHLGNLFMEVLKERFR